MKPISVHGMISKVSLVKINRFHQSTLQISENNTNVTQNSYRDPGVLLIWIIIEQGPTSLSVGAGWFVWHFLSHSFFSLPPKDGLI